MTAVDVLHPETTTDVGTKKKILHFFPDHFNWGGIQVYLSYTLPRLQQNGDFNIVAVCTKDSKLFYKLKEAGLNVHGLSFPLKKKNIVASWFRKPLLRTLDFPVYFKMLAILKREQPDLVHIHSGRVEYACVKWAGFKLVYTYHGYGAVYNIESEKSWFHRAYYRLMRPLFQWLIPFLDGMTIVSQYERDRLYRSKFLPKSFVPDVVYNGLPHNSFTEDELAQCRQELNIPEGTKVISLISRLVPAKNTKPFIALARQLLKTKPDDLKLYFLVAGEGKQAPAFDRAFNHDSLLSKHGQYLGFRNDPAKLMAISDVIVSTSRQEGFGLRVIEAFQQGTPFVGYHVGGQVEIIPEDLRERFLAPRNNLDHLRQLILQILAEPDAEKANLAIRLKQHANQFSIDENINALTTFYKRVLAQ